MIKIKKRYYLYTLLTVLLASFFIVYNTKIGEKILKTYISSKLTLLEQFEIKSFKYSMNSFSLMMQKGNNYVYLYGNIFPFNATYEANLDNLSQLTHEIKGSLKSSGILKYKNIVYIKGNALFANGYSNLQFQCDKKCIGLLAGQNFNTSKLLKMLKINLPYIIGSNDLYIVFNKDFNNLKSNFKIDLNKDDLSIKDITGQISVKFKNRNNFTYDLMANNKSVSCILKGTKKNNNLIIGGEVKIPLNLLKQYTLYNLKGTEDLKISYESKNNILKFAAQYFNGNYMQDVLTININKMPSKKFFEYLDLKEIIKSKINGIVKIINQEGNFDLVINNPVLQENNNIVRYIKNKSGEKLNSFNVMFLKGSFDNQKIIFSVLAKNNNIVLSIKDGVYFYNGKNKYTIDLVIKDKKEYIFEVNNNKIKLIKIIQNVESSNDVSLVF